VVAVLLVGAAATSGAVSTGTIKARVMYPDAGGVFHPLAGVEVWLLAGGSHYACTNGSGFVTFTDIPAGSGYLSATGVSISSLHCANGEFLQPGTHLKLHNLFQGGISLAAGQTKNILFQLGQPPADQMQVCGGETPTLVGTAGRDVLVGTEARDVISSGGGNDTLNGLGGNDVLCGGPGRDRLVGGGGDDLMFGEAGADSDGNRGLFGGPGTDTAYGGYGIDFCDAETGLGCENP
jgi:Ca2+-binding RTX toxin-like protein